MQGVSKYDEIEGEVESDEKEVFADDGHFILVFQSSIYSVAYT